MTSASRSRSTATSRRRFLQGTAAAAVVAPIVGAPLSSARPDYRVRVRRNVHDLLPDDQGNDHPIIAAYKSGIEVMRARPEDDPTSWIFQANIHGSTVALPDPAFDQCQHGSFFFLSWHRIYLHFFERIVRDASGEPDFALPYWNYSDDLQQAPLPEPFRLPADTANPLFVSQRHPLVNGGTALPDWVTTYQAAFELANFTPTADESLSFGGEIVPAPLHFGASHSELESQPHDIIHVIVGGNGGLMTNPNTAARDPIFWLHHANVDRLWERWIGFGEGRANPSDAVWLDTEFSFFDENAKQVILTGADVIDVVSQLGYSYDDAPEAPLPGPVGPEIVMAGAASEAAAQAQTLATSETAGTTVLGEGAQRIPLTPAARPAGAEAAMAEATEAQRVQLVIDEIKSAEPIGAAYQVYLNLPDSTAPQPDSVFYVGNFSFFGRSTDARRCVQGVCGQVFDITALAKRQIDEGVWQEDEPSVTLVLSGLPMAQGEAIRLDPGAEPEIGQITIVKR